jgi:hypothetical protein
MKSVFALVAVVVLGTFSGLTAQETNYAFDVFEDSRIVNGQSVETSREGQMKFIIAHRFGRVSDGLSEFFGFDQSTIRLGLDYGITDWLNIGIGRSSFEKTVDGFLKIRLLRQKKGDQSFPFSMVLFSDVALNTSKFTDEERENYFSSRASYAHQLLIASKLSDRISLQLSPSLVHRNLVATSKESNDVIAIGVAPQFRLSKVISMSAEYYYVLPDQLAEEFTNSLALGLNIHTNGHVFQLHFGNSLGMIEKFFITETRDSWEKGEIHFGFNITRDFQIRGRKHH